MINLIYHSDKSYDRVESPFYRAIRETADFKELWIVWSVY